MKTQMTAARLIASILGVLLVSCSGSHRTVHPATGELTRHVLVIEELPDVTRHRQTILVGSIVVIAGVAFIAVSAGAGLVVFAPAVLLAS